MDKQPRIKWNKNDRKNIANMARKFNAKITRISNKSPEISKYLPNKINSKELQQNIESRRELNKLLNKYGRFLDKGAENIVQSKKGVTTTEWMKKEVSIDIGVINRKRSSERKRADVSTYKGTMGTVGANNLQPKTFNFDEISSQKAWKEYVRSAEKQSSPGYNSEKQSNYKKNYIMAIRNTVGYGVDADKIVKLIEKIDSDSLYYSYYDDQILQLNFWYDEHDKGIKIRSVYNKWAEKFPDIAKELENSG